MRAPHQLSRRAFVQSAATGMMVGMAPTRRAFAINEKPQPLRITLAQLRSESDVTKNVARAKDVFGQAQKDKAGWVFFPELYLTGTHNGPNFKQNEVAKGFAELQRQCRERRIIGLIGTGWALGGKLYNQVRIVDATGKLVGHYDKTCLTYDDARSFTTTSCPLVYRVGGLSAGILICNDLWVTPGYSDGPNPHLTLKQVRAGAQVIFHAIGSGSDPRYRAYHESNLMTRAAEAGCPIVTVNAFAPPSVNATSGVVGTGFRYEQSLPRDREAVQTVEFTPAVARTKPK